jgi:hypothetical protein
MPADGPADDQASQPDAAGAGRPLSPEVSEQMEVVYGVIGPYLDLSLEELEIDLMRDPEPEQEALAWMRITAAWDAYHLQYLNEEVLDDDEEHKIVAALIAISDGERNMAALAVGPDVGKKLLDCFRALGGD